MSWTAILVLAAGAYAFKAAGLLGFGGTADDAPAVRVGRLLPAALLTALVVVQTLEGQDGDIVLDARAAGIAAGAIAVWLRAPFVAVIVVSAVVTATVRVLA